MKLFCWKSPFVISHLPFSKTLQNLPWSFLIYWGFQKCYSLLPLLAFDFEILQPDNLFDGNIFGFLWIAYQTALLLALSPGCSSLRFVIHWTYWIGLLLFGSKRASGITVVVASRLFSLDSIVSAGSYKTIFRSSWIDVHKLDIPGIVLYHRIKASQHLSSITNVSKVTVL